MPFLADPSCQNCFAILTGEIPPKYFLEKLMHHVITSGSVLSKFNFDKARSRHNFSRKNYGGERGIRTLDTLLEYARFPGVCLQPLGHLSAGNKTLAMHPVGRNLFQPSGQIGSISVEFLPDKSGVPNVRLPHECGVPIANGTPDLSGNAWGSVGC